MRGDIVGVECGVVFVVGDYFEYYGGFIDVCEFVGIVVD